MQNVNRLIAHLTDINAVIYTPKLRTKLRIHYSVQYNCIVKIDYSVIYIMFSNTLSIFFPILPSSVLPKDPK